MAARVLALIMVLVELCPSVWSAAQSSSCQFGQSVGDGCVYLCHCEHQVTCSSADGSCGFGGCTEAVRSGHDYTPSWTGPGCQIGDAFDGKSATSGPEVVMDPNLALNGNTNTAGSCAISRSQDGSAAWWQVDMGDSFLVMSVTVTSSANTAYLAQSRVDIGATLQDANFQLCGNINAIRNAGDVFVKCEPHRQGRYVRITRLDTGVHTGEMRLCQVYAMAFLVRDCEPCYYGAGCLTECDCSGNTCDDVTGECLPVSCAEARAALTTTPTNITETTDDDLSEGLTSMTSGGVDDPSSGGQGLASLSTLVSPVLGICLLLVGLLVVMI